MISLTINGLQTSVEKGTTLLEAARFLGFPIPTLCYNEGLSPYGACRLCVVEIGEGKGARLGSSCTYPAQEGLVVRTRIMPTVQGHSGPGRGPQRETAALQTRV
jgi:bidirectional [NiFe] hydrogenase diaphorase subunit